MNNFEQGYYQNFFTLSDEDKIKGIVHLTPFLPTKFPYITANDEFPSTYIIKKGNKWADLLFTDSARLVLVVSERFRKIFDGYKGISFIPIQIFPKGSHSISERYYTIIISGRCGKLIKELSKEVIATRIPGGPIFTERVGLYFDPSSWDGSDFCTPEGTLNIFITQKVREVIQENKLTNIRIIPITEEVNYVL